MPPDSPYFPVRYTLFAPSALDDRIGDTIRPVLDPHAESTEYPERTRGAGYYSPAAIEIATQDGGGKVHLGDGGFVDWTAQFPKTPKSAASSAVWRQPAWRH